MFLTASTSTGASFNSFAISWSGNLSVFTFVFTSAVLDIKLSIFAETAFNTGEALTFTASAFNSLLNSKRDTFSEAMFLTVSISFGVSFNSFAISWSGNFTARTFSFGWGGTSFMKLLILFKIGFNSACFSDFDIKNSIFSFNSIGLTTERLKLPINSCSLLVKANSSEISFKRTKSVVGVTPFVFVDFSLINFANCETITFLSSLLSVLFSFNSFSIPLIKFVRMFFWGWNVSSLLGTSFENSFFIFATMACVLLLSISMFSKLKTSFKASDIPETTLFISASVSWISVCLALPSFIPFGELPFNKFLSNFWISTKATFP